MPDEKVTTTMDIVEQVQSEIGKDIDWTKELQLVKDISAKGCTDTEFKLLVYTAKLYGLDPLKKEIWAIKYGSSPANIMAGRDGFLSIAHRSGKFNGMKTEFKPSEKTEVPGIKTAGIDMDSTATCTVYRKDMANPISVTVQMREYYNMVNPVWKSKPITMLCKVAEAQALRKSFNVSGLYDPDEFDVRKNSTVTNATVVEEVDD